MNVEYSHLMERVKDIGRLESIEALLDWDQETLMLVRESFLAPTKGISFQLSRMRYQ